MPPGVPAYFAPKGDPPVLRAAVVLVRLLVRAPGFPTARRRRETEELRLLRRASFVAERLRIAGELHDAVGHSVNAVLVRAGAGRLVLDTGPDRTRELLSSVERAGRDASAELDRDTASYPLAGRTGR